MDSTAHASLGLYVYYTFSHIQEDNTRLIKLPKSPGGESRIITMKTFGRVKPVTVPGMLVKSQDRLHWP